MVFVQSSAHTGWTKFTSHNDVALRVISGNTGGTYVSGDGSFSAIFASNRATSGGNVSNHTLSTNQIPGHNHGFDNGFFAENNGNRANPNDIAGSNKGNDWDNNAFTFNDSTSNSGGGASHGHGFTHPRIDLKVHYVDTIIATKD